MSKPANHRYLIFNKPYGVLSQFTGPSPTLRDFIPVPGIYPVGRLDRDSEGLMLLTGDGPLQHRLTDPRYEHPRIYQVQVEGIPDEAGLKRLSQGVNVQEYVTRPAQVRLLEEDPRFPPRDPPVRFRKSIPTCWIELTLREGRNRQVRRMTAAVGHPTLRLIRVAIGPIRLTIGPGEWRDLRPEEVALLKMRTKEPRSPTV